MPFAPSELPTRLAGRGPASAFGGIRFLTDSLDKRRTPFAQIAAKVARRHREVGPHHRLKAECRRSRGRRPLTLPFREPGGAVVRAIDPGRDAESLRAQLLAHLLRGEEKTRLGLTSPGHREVQRTSGGGND